MGLNRKNCKSALVSIFFFTNVFTQTNILTNQEIISRIFIPPALAILSDTLHITESIKIQSPEVELLSGWTAQILTDSCLSKKYLVYSDADSSTAQNYSIILSDAKVDILYRSAGRKWLFFKKGIYRSIRGDYHIQVLNSENQIIFSRRVSKNYEDIIPSGSEKSVENPNLTFTQGTKSGSSYIKRWLEPVIITVTSAIVIYLFYSLRSEK